MSFTGPKPPSTGATGFTPPPAGSPDSESGPSPSRHIPPAGPRPPQKSLYERQPPVSVNIPPEMVNTKKAEVRKLTQELMLNCERQAQLEGQKFLHARLNVLSQQLENPGSAPPPQGYRLVFVPKGKPPVSVIPPEPGGPDVQARVKALQQKARPFVQEAKAYFSQQRIQEIDRKLEHNRQEAGKLVVQLQELNVNPVVRDIVPMRAPLRAASLAAELGQPVDPSKPQPPFSLMPEPVTAPVPSRPPVATPPLKPADLTQRQKTQQWLAFYRSGGKIDGQKYTLEQIRKLSDHDLENEHSFIQLLFPNSKVSGSNSGSPLLTAEMIAEIQRDPELQDELLKSLDQMLRFWGLQRQGDHISVQMGRGDRHAKWLGAHDHNHLRITRVLNCLMDCGFVSCACSLEEILQECRRNNRQAPNPEWVKAVQNDSGINRQFFSVTQQEALLNVRSYKDYQARYPYRHYQHDVQNIFGFYDRDRPGYSFTNFFDPDEFNPSRDPEGAIIIEGRKWRTTEHYFQASKFAAGSDDWLAVKNCQTPRDAYQYVRTPRAPDNQPPRIYFADWHAGRKDAVMMKALRAKASCCDQFRHELLATGNKPLFETSPNDWYWGVAQNPTDHSDGLNTLGAMLMQLRDELRAEEELDVE